MPGTRRQSDFEDAIETDSAPRTPTTPYFDADAMTSIIATLQQPQLPHDSSRNDVPAPRPVVADGNSPSSTNKNRFCVYCKRYGHLRDECLKLKEKPDSDDTQVIATCYGCNAIGVTRSQWEKCNADYYAVAVAWSTPASDLSTGDVEHQVSTLKCTKRNSSMPVPTG